MCIFLPVRIKGRNNQKDVGAKLNWVGWHRLVSFLDFIGVGYKSECTHT